MARARLRAGADGTRRGSAPSCLCSYASRACRAGQQSYYSLVVRGQAGQRFSAIASVPRCATDQRPWPRACQVELGRGERTIAEQVTRNARADAKILACGQTCL